MKKLKNTALFLLCLSVPLFLTSFAHPTEEEMNNGNIIFTADSDAIITKGIIALVIRVFSNHTPKEIAEADLFFIDQIGLKEHLSPTRSNGLLSMVKQIKLYSIAFQAKA